MVETMIHIYCRGNHRTKKDELCPDCLTLEIYALRRMQTCPYMETKTFCSACKVHCYSAKRREEIKQVMRYAGPRMMFVKPSAAIKHVKTTIEAKGEKRHVS